MGIVGRGLAPAGNSLILQIRSWFVTDGYFGGSKPPPYGTNLSPSPREKVARVARRMRVSFTANKKRTTNGRPYGIQQHL